MYGRQYEARKRQAIRDALSAPKPGEPTEFPQIEPTPPPGMPTLDEITQRAREIREEDIARKRAERSAEWTPAHATGPPGIRECRVHRSR